MPTSRPASPPLTSAPPASGGMLLGFVGVAIFSQTLPFTRMAVAELDPIFVALARAVLAALLALALLAWRGALSASRR
ncbi:MAG: EamA family transporter, partial [Cupriavidus necator]